MAAKKALLVAYGGGHITMIVPVAAENGAIAAGPEAAKLETQLVERAQGARTPARGPRFAGRRPGKPPVSPQAARRTSAPARPPAPPQRTRLVVPDMRRA